MKKWFSLFLAVCFVFIVASSAAADSIPEDVLSQIDKVFYVETQDKKNGASGTAFLIANDEEGSFLLTNHHVIKLNYDNVVVWTGNGQVTSASVVAKDERYDLAVIKTTATIHETPVVFSTDATRGSAVYAVGFPGDAEYLSDSALRTSQDATVTDGIISAVRSAQIVSGGPSVSIIQTNASINHGNSGGPLFDQKGFVVGVNTYGVSSGIFGAISSSSVADFLRENNLSGLVSLNSAANQGAKGNPDKIWLIWPFVAIGIAILTLIAMLIMALTGKGKRSGKKKTEMPLYEYASKLPEPLSDVDIVSLLMPVAKELRDKHAEGLVHASISPHSIIVSKKGCRIDPKYRQSAYIATEFIAPEQQAGKGASVRTDIYSFCRLLAYLRRAGDTTPAPSYCEEDAIAAEKPQDASVLSEVIQKGTSEAAEDRFLSMQEIIYALAGLNASSLSSTALAPFSGKKTSSGPSQRNKKLWSPVAVGASLLILSFAANQIIVGQKLKTAAETKDYDGIARVYPNYYFPGHRIKKYLEFYSAGLDLSNGNYSDAYLRFKMLGDFHDSANLAKESRYRYAKELLSYGKCEDAKKLFADLSDYQDSRSLAKECDYQKAASLAEEGEYAAAIELYSALGDYKDSAELVYETKVERGLSYLDAKQYEKALAEFKALKADGWADAKEGIDLTYYVWGNDLAKKADYIEAYKKLANCANYKDTAQIRTNLRGTIYQQGQSYYRKGYYPKASICFNAIDTYYSRVSDYLRLISMHNKTYLSKDDVKKLVAILSFEDAKAIILHEHNGAQYFLEGTWRNSNYYFTMRSDGHTSYNLPFFNYGEYYKIQNGQYQLYFNKTPNTTRTLFTFTIIDKNTISILCAKDGKTYTLKRN